jgi:hypothetical protein
MPQHAGDSASGRRRRRLTWDSELGVERLKVRASRDPSPRFLKTLKSLKRYGWGMDNPFTPTFGTSPPLLVGRDNDLEDFREGLVEGPGSPERATLLTGLRGTGKTAMLNAYEDVAAGEGWLVISETARPGLVQRLTEEHLPTLLREHDPRRTQSRLTAVSLPGRVGAEREVKELHNPIPSLRSQLNLLVDLVGQAGGGGVLITVDEITNEKPSLADLRDLGDVVQHAFRARHNVAFAGAGLPAEVNGLLAGKGTTFLRRADRR